MSLIIDIDKQKNIAMMIETSGIENKENLSFTFNITVDGVKYGFPCKLDENKVNIEIPALSKIINNLKSGTYKASLDVVGNGKHFIQPFNEDVVLKGEPKIKVLTNTEKSDDRSIKSENELYATISEIVENVGGKVKTHKVSKIFDK